MFYIHKTPDSRSVATIQDFTSAPGEPWEKYDAAAEAWVEDAKAAFVPPVSDEQAEEENTELFRKSIETTISDLKNDLRSQADQVVSLRASVVELLKKF